MAQRSVWVPWDQQPQEYAPVDPDHPLGRALDAAWIGNDLGGVDVLKGHKVSLLSGVTIANTTRGKAFAHTGTSGSVVAIPGEASLPYVQIGYGYFNTAGGAWILSSLNTAAGGYTSRLALASSTTVALDIRWNFGTSRTLTITLPTTLNTPICAALVAYSSADYRFFCNGQQQNGTLSPGTFGSLDRMFGPGDTINGGVWFTGFGSGVAVSDADMLDITANPEARLWGMFQRRIWVPVTAAAGGFTLTAESGSYALTGQAASLLVARTVVAEQGSYALTGQGATLTKSILMLAEQGSYALTGQSAGLFASRQLLAEQGAYALSGQDATLTYTPAGAYTLTANSGSYALAGQDAALLLARTLVAAQGSYALTGQDATLSSGKILLAASGSYTLTGQDAAFRRTYALAAGFGSYTLTGQVATLTYSAGIVAILEQVRLRSRITQTVSAPSRITQQLALRSQVRH